MNGKCRLGGAFCSLNEFGVVDVGVQEITIGLQEITPTVHEMITGVQEIFRSVHEIFNMVQEIGTIYSHSFIHQTISVF
ncbi:hypothetical protein [Jeotgalibacillus haloalkalitolerans]|uniref:LXG domain-containing protein n=1 Tax=Jeotgalibacillus haloalkalitolerans TaxID=3104292 RepID=A0ABU5KIA4_9BACL|nr:hypothetical protein [Jeotgalibacillus sp. HH7-29]MDZ5710974.1 hypothetical protein [Jeotgalibacillus sp. HH7-29]